MEKRSYEVAAMRGKVTSSEKEEATARFLYVAKKDGYYFALH